jgi:hypothetical protein
MNFLVRFMYSVQKCSYVYVVFGVCATDRVDISGAGLGKTLGKVFTKNGDRNTFVSIVCLSSANCRGGEVWPALAIAHIASLRCSNIANLGKFGKQSGDVGDSRAAYTVDYMRASSFPYVLCGSLSGLQHGEMLKRKEEITAELSSKGLPQPWGCPEDAWCLKRKLTSVVSVLFQVSVFAYGKRKESSG